MTMIPLGVLREEEATMNRSFVVTTALAAMLVAAWISQPRSQGSPDRNAPGADWSVKADYTDACCCQPSCPCFFGSAPTLGYCEGVSVVEFEEAHYGGVRLDGVKVVAVYRGNSWIKFYVGDKASEEQTEAAVKLLPAFEEFFAIENVLEVKNVPISVERTDETVKISTPNTTSEIEIMKGKNGKPIKIDNLPWPSFPGPPLNDHTQYRTIVLKHEGKDQRFEYSGTNGFTAKIETDAKASH
jgi:hypothetical protein